MSPEEILRHFDLESATKIGENVYTVQAEQWKEGRTYQITKHLGGWTGTRTNSMGNRGRMVLLPEKMTMALVGAFLLLDPPDWTWDTHVRNAKRAQERMAKHFWRKNRRAAP